MWVTFVCYKNVLGLTVWALWPFATASWVYRMTCYFAVGFRPGIAVVTWYGCHVMVMHLEAVLTSPCLGVYAHWLGFYGNFLELGKTIGFWLCVAKFSSKNKKNGARWASDFTWQLLSIVLGNFFRAYWAMGYCLGALWVWFLTEMVDSDEFFSPYEPIYDVPVAQTHDSRLWGSRLTTLGHKLTRPGSYFRATCYSDCIRWE